LTGAAIGVSVIPKRGSSIHKIVHLFVFILLANLPDLPMIGWGHEKYFYSHSLFVNGLFIALGFLFLTLSNKTFRQIGGWPVLIAGAGAWLSHLLLDSFYNQGLGVMIFWPFSSGRLILPIPWLAALPSSPPPITAAMIPIFVLEFLTFSPFLLFAILARMFDLDVKAKLFVSSLIRTIKKPN
jgi:hypothetical protein